MKKAKTIIEWLSEFKENGFDWAESAIKNTQKGGNTDLITLNAKAAIFSGFVWSDTTEGEAFWNEIYKNL